MANEVVLQFKANPKQTKTVSERDAKILVGLGRWEYQTAALEAGPPARVRRPRAKKAPEPPVEVPAEPSEPPAPEDVPPAPPAEPTE